MSTSGPEQQPADAVAITHLVIHSMIEAWIQDGTSNQALEDELVDWYLEDVAEVRAAVRRAVLAECVHCGEREGAHADAYVCIPGAPDVAPPGTVFESREAALARLPRVESALIAESEAHADERGKLRARVGKLEAALERTLGNFERLLARTPVRDATETIAEARAALGPDVPAGGAPGAGAEGAP